MPPWLMLLLAVAALVLWVGIEAAMTMGSRRVFGVAVSQFTRVLLLLAAPAIIVLVVIFILAS